MADLDREFKAAEDDHLRGQEAIQLVRQRAADRSSIAKLIIVTFVSLVSVVVVAAIAGTYLLGWDELV